MKVKFQRGFSLIEILVVIGILAVVLGILIISWQRLNRTYALNTETLKVAALLEEARTRALGSHNASAYGVHLATNQAVMFVGETFNGTDPNNVVVDLGNGVTISEIALSAAATDVVFNRLTGEASHFGMLTLADQTAAAQTRTITLYQSGILEVND